MKEIDVFKINDDDDDDLSCLFCYDAKVSGELVTGKYWDDEWELEFLKQHLPCKSHLAGVNALKNQNRNARTLTFLF